MAYPLRALGAAEDLSSLPSVSHISSNSQLPVTPTSGDPVLSSEQEHTCMCTYMHIHTQIIKTFRKV